MQATREDMELVRRLQTTPPEYGCYESWAEYRENLTAELIRNTEEGSSVSIYGAGYCNDVDLKKLAGHFGRIILIDKNAEALEQAVNHFESEPNCANALREKISYKKIDLVGITDEEYAAFLRRVVVAAVESISRQSKPDNDANISQKGKESDNSPKNKESDNSSEGKESDNTTESIKVDNSLEKEILAVEKKIYDEYTIRKLPDLPETDYSVMFGLHSQLNNMFPLILHTINEIVKYQVVGAKGLSVQTVAQVEEIARCNTIYIVERVNRAVINATKKCVFTSLELENNRREVQIDGAFQALTDLKRMETEHKIEKVFSKELIWPLSRERDITYRMEFASYIIKQPDESTNY